MNQKIYVAPSLLSADPMNMGEEIKSVESAGADWHHVDVMDGHFVPNLTYGPHFIKGLKKIATIPLDVHIMVSNPDAVAMQYVEAGADRLSFHIEAAKNPRKIAEQIAAGGAKPALTVSPDTPIEKLFPYLDCVDHVLIMSVYPGFGGQKFLESAIEKVRLLHQEVQAKGIQDFIIEVDGGVNRETAKVVKDAGANALVAGSFVYRSDDRKAAIENLK